MKDFNFKNFWKNSNEFKKEMPTDSEIIEIEKRLQHPLPQDYIDLMKLSQNGGMLSKNAFVKENEQGEINELYKIDFIDAINALNSEQERKLLAGSATWPDVGIYFGMNLDGREMFALNYLDSKNEPSVSVILYSRTEKKSYPKTIANSFKEFVQALRKLDKPPVFDFENLKEEIKTAVRKTYNEFKNQSTEKIIAFGLYTGSEGNFVASAINTEEHFNTQISKYPKEKEFYTYATTEWKYEGNEAPENFAKVDNLIQKHLIFLTSDNKKNSFRKQLLDTCTSVLKELKDENLFSEQLVLMVNISDEELPKAQFKKIVKELNG